MKRIRNKNTNQVHVCRLQHNGQVHVHKSGTLDFDGEWENIGGFNSPWGEKFSDNWEHVEKCVRENNSWNTYFLTEKNEWVLLKPEQVLNNVLFDDKNIVLQF